MKVQSKQEVIKTIQNNLDKFAEFGVSKIGLFGSFVREEATNNSDVDLLVAIDNYNYSNFCKLISFTESLFGRKVDILTEDSINEISGIYICQEVEYVSAS